MPGMLIRVAPRFNFEATWPGSRGWLFGKEQPIAVSFCIFLSTDHNRNNAPCLPRCFQ